MWFGISPRRSFGQEVGEAGGEGVKRPCDDAAAAAVGRGVELTAFVPSNKKKKKRDAHTKSRPAFVLAPPIMFAPLQNMFSDDPSRNGKIG